MQGSGEPEMSKSSEWKVLKIVRIFLMFIQALNDGYLDL